MDPPPDSIYEADAPDDRPFDEATVAIPEQAAEEIEACQPDPVVMEALALLRGSMDSWVKEVKSAPSLPPPTAADSSKKLIKRIAPTLLTSVVSNRGQDASSPSHMITSNLSHGDAFPASPGSNSHITLDQLSEDDTMSNTGLMRGNAADASNRLSAQQEEGGAYKSSVASSAVRRRPLHSNIRFLRKGKLPVDKLFYHKTAMGSVIKQNSDSQREINQTWNRLPCTLLRRQYVHAMMLRFLRAKRRRFSRGENSYVGIVPYNPSLVGRLEGRSINPSFTLFTTKRHKVVAKRMPYPNWSEVQYARDQNSNSLEAGTLDFHGIQHLMDNMGKSEPGPQYLDELAQRWQNQEGGDEELPLYGDSGSEGEYDDQTWVEMDKERAEQAKRASHQDNVRLRKPLPKLKVLEIVEERVEEFVTKWVFKYLPKKLQVYCDLWHTAHHEGTVLSRIKWLKAQIQTINTINMPALKKKILEEALTSKTAVLLACRNIEPTIWNREGYKFKLSVLRSDTPPDVPPVVPRTKPGIKLVRPVESEEIEDADDEEEDEAKGSVTSEASLSGFIDDDDVDDGDDDILGREHLADEDRQRFIENDEAPLGNTYETNPFVVMPGCSKRHASHVNASQRSPSTPSRSASKLRLKGFRRQTESEGPESQQISSPALIDLITPGKNQNSGEIIDLITPEKDQNGKEATKKRVKIILRYNPNSAETVDDEPHPATSHLDASDQEDVPLSAIKRRGKRSAMEMDEAVEPDTPCKPKKRKLIENTDAKDMREHDRQRLFEQDERRKILQAKLAELGTTGPTQGTIINVSKYEDQGCIYVNSIASPRIQNHQIEGIRFLWDQLIVDQETNQGCLLAHTMGLGKTMQTISLLVAIAEAAASFDPSVSSQIPPRLRVSKTLILCPPGLINNWLDELLMWVPKEVLGTFWKVDSALTLEERLSTISRWYNEGGVLLMGYQLFRTMIFNCQADPDEEEESGKVKGPKWKTLAGDQEDQKHKRLPPLKKTEHQQVRMELLEGPNIIIADEAHVMKNVNSQITKAAAKFRSRTRIALTGSPLANDVGEYYSMVEWVAPNYLGPIEEFREKYKNPIEAGFYFDSEPSQRRKSLKMLGVLHEDLSPKVNRADLSVLRHQLAPKKEFIIKMPLTDLQLEAYKVYIRCMIAKAPCSEEGDVMTSTLLAWISILKLLCNHPSCFFEELRTPMKKPKKSISQAGRQTVEQGPPASSQQSFASSLENVSLPAHISEDLKTQQARILDSVKTDLSAPELSNKTKLLSIILHASKAAKDKVLIFSHSIPTLQYLKRFCNDNGYSNFMLTGKTATHVRQRDVKAFNEGHTDVFLISTTAGGIGLNLIGANRIVIFDFSYNPVHEEQAVARAYRIGQQKPVFVYRFLIGGVFEDSIHNTAVFKTQLASRVVDKRRPVAMAHRKFGEIVHEPKDVPQSDLGEFRGMDHILDELLALQSRDYCIRSIVQTDSFEKDDNDHLTLEEQAEVQALLREEKKRRMKL